jgi:hypothetical protein
MGTVADNVATTCLDGVIRVGRECHESPVFMRLCKQAGEVCKTFMQRFGSVRRLRTIQLSPSTYSLVPRGPRTHRITGHRWLQRLLEPRGSVPQRMNRPSPNGSPVPVAAELTSPVRVSNPEHVVRSEQA